MTPRVILAIALTYLVVIVVLSAWAIVGGDPGYFRPDR